MLTDDQADALCRQSASKFEAMRAAVRAHQSALVAFSGGVDSTLVLKVALDELGERAVALTALSASVDPHEAQHAKAVALQLGARHLVVESNELSDPRYAANSTDRCYFCKSELFSISARHRAELGLNIVLDGFNADDTSDHRPGRVAAKERQVSSPLAEANLSKVEIRAWSKRLGLSTWDKPQTPCLASRLPYGTQVTVERLQTVGLAERAVRRLGFVNFRVRHHGEVARLEFASEELPRLNDADLRLKVSAAVREAGFGFVAVDLEPFRSGRMNDGRGQGAQTS